MQSLPTRKQAARAIALLVRCSLRLLVQSEFPFVGRLGSATDAGSAQAFGTDGTTWSRGMEPVHRRVEPVEPVEFRNKWGAYIL